MSESVDEPAAKYEREVDFEVRLVPAARADEATDATEGAEADAQVAAAAPPAAPQEDSLADAVALVSLPNNRTLELPHSLTSLDADSLLSPRATLVADEPLVRHLVESQGYLPMSLVRKTAGVAKTLFELQLDVTPLLFGRRSVSVSYDADAGALASSPLPEAALALVRAVHVNISLSQAFVSDELARRLNPLAVTVLRADGLPPAYSGTPFKAPYQELAERCEPVRVTWRLLGHERSTAPAPHGPRILWRGERTLLLAGELGERELARRLREEGITVELHDRDPIPPPPPLPTGPPEAEAEEAAAPAASKSKPGKGKKEATAAAARDKTATAAAGTPPPPTRPPPHGVSHSRLSAMVGRRPTDATRYAPTGLRSVGHRRQTLCLDIMPCARPLTKPEPEEEDLEYFAGSYVESACTVTLGIELAHDVPDDRALEGATDHALGEAIGSVSTDGLLPVQRIVAMIRYADTRLLKQVLGTVEEVNAKSGVATASGWDAHRETGATDVDFVSGLHLVDGPSRLFVLEGLPARFGGHGEPLSAMARLSRILAPKEPNSSVTFSLMDSRLLFPRRLYASFEQPLKLIRVREPMSQLVLRPELYLHLRVDTNCRDAVLALANLLASKTLRLAHKAEAFPRPAGLYALEKKFGATISISDREGVSPADFELIGSDSSRPATRQTSAPTGGGAIGALRALNHPRHTKSKPRKAPTDSRCPRSLREAAAARETAEPVDYIARAMAALPPPKVKVLPEWYAATLPPADAPAFAYSGQRLNATEVQKAALRKALRHQAKGSNGVLHVYTADYLSGESMGDREIRPPRPARGKLWDNTKPVALNPDGTRSHFNLFQPSRARCEELRVPWGSDEYEAMRTELRETARRERRYVKPPFDALPSKKTYLDENPEERFRSVFAQTEEGAAAEHAERVTGAIKQWEDKVVVQNPTLKLRMRSTDRSSAVEKQYGILHDPPQKRALRALFRGKNPLTNSYGKQTPSIFLGEQQEVLAGALTSREVDKNRWMSDRDFAAGRVQESERSLGAMKETKRSIPPLSELDRTHPAFARQTATDFQTAARDKIRSELSA